MTGHTIEVRIYYADTDCAGVVYYANYLRYFERARTEFFEQRGVSLKELMEEGIYFVVVDASLSYHQPGRYGDRLMVDTELTDTGPATISFAHRVRRGGTDELLVTGSVRLAAVSGDLRPRKLPGVVRNALRTDGGA